MKGSASLLADDSHHSLRLIALSEINVQETLQEWRNNLFAVSSQQKLFVAVADEIYVYTYTLREITFETRLTNRGRCKRSRQPRPESDSFHSAAINRIKVGRIGNDEALVTVDGLGRVFVRFISSLHSKPLLFDVKSSAWGIAVSPRHRLLAISCNSATVYVFDLEKGINEVGALRRYRLQDNIPDIAFSSDGTELIACDISHGIRIFFLDHDLEYKAPMAPESCWSAAILDPDMFIEAPEPENKYFMKVESSVMYDGLPGRMFIMVYENWLRCVGPTRPAIFLVPSQLPMNRWNFMHVIPSLNAVVLANQVGILYVCHLQKSDGEYRIVATHIDNCKTDRDDIYIYGMDVVEDEDCARIFVMTSDRLVRTYLLSKNAFTMIDLLKRSLASLDRP